MAVVYLSPGVYKDTKTGKTIKATSQADAKKKAQGGGGGGNKAGGGGSGDGAADPATGFTDQQQRLVDDLDFGRRMANQFGLNNPLERLAATTPEAIQGLISQAQTAYDTAGNRSPEIQRLIATMEGGLGGLTAEENTAMRESAMEELTRSYQTAERQQLGQQAVSGVRGAAAAARFDNLNRSMGEGQRALERDILLENINIQNQRRDAFGNLVRGVETDEFGRRNTAFGNLAGLQVGEQTRLDGINRFNLGQGEREKAMALQGSLGFSGLLAGQRDADRVYGLAKKSVGQPGAQLQTYGTGGGMPAGYAEAMKQMLQNTFPNEYGTITGEGSSGGAI